MKWLKPGGEIIIGNFNENLNPSIVFMEIFSELYLNHCIEEQPINLAIDAGFRKEKIKVEREPENVNLFLRIKQIQP